MTGDAATASGDRWVLGEQGAQAGGGDELASVSRGVMAEGRGSPTLSLSPEDIEVSAAVDARFTATTG